MTNAKGVPNDDDNSACRSASLRWYPVEMNREWIHDFLANDSYWAQGRTRETLDRAMDASLNFGMFDAATGTQVAFARVITDTATFGWLCDVFVDESVRGRGVGVSFIEHIMTVLEPMSLKRVGLTTADAHGLYEKFGFAPIQDTAPWMVRSASGS